MEYVQQYDDQIASIQLLTGKNMLLLNGGNFDLLASKITIYFGDNIAREILNDALTQIEEFVCMKLPLNLINRGSNFL